MPSGPSGCGKTTLLRLAAGVETPLRGRILLDDREVAGPECFVPPEDRGVGLMFQDYALFPHLDVLQNVLFGLRALAPKDAQTAATRALSRVGMESYVDASRTCCPAESNSGSRWPAPLRRAPA